jgi:hypothetical protein
MNFKTILLGTVALALMAAPAVASSASSVDARIDQLEQEIQQLKAAQTQAAPAPSDAVSQAQFEALQNQVYEQQAATTSMTKSSWWANTSISGRMYFDLTNVSSKSAGVDNPQNGTHFDVKRFYVSIDHAFDDVWSADVTTDFTYDTSQCNGIKTTTDPVTGDVLSATCSGSGASASQLYIKKAYLQGKFDDLAVLRLGAFDMPWIPFAEDAYGYRYVENTLVDRLKYGNSADWGAGLSGSTGSDLKFEYSLAAINGAGYKKPGFGLGTNRSKGMDFEGRFDVKYDGFVLAVGGYDGKLGKEMTPDTTVHNYTRFDALAAYVADGFHVGVEYFSDHNFNDITTSGVTDSGDGWSGFAAYQFDPKWALFGRYDDTNPTKGTAKGQPDFTNKYYNVGIEWTPTKIVNLSLVYKHDSGSNGSLGDSNGLIGGTSATTSGHYDEVGLFGQLRW